MESSVLPPHTTEENPLNITVAIQAKPIINLPKPPQLYLKGRIVPS